VVVQPEQVDEGVDAGADGLDSGGDLDDEDFVRSEDDGEFGWDYNRAGGDDEARDEIDEDEQDDVGGDDGGEGAAGDGANWEGDRAYDFFRDGHYDDEEGGRDYELVEDESQALGGGAGDSEQEENDKEYDVFEDGQEVDSDDEVDGEAEDGGCGLVSSMYDDDDDDDESVNLADMVMDNEQDGEADVDDDIKLAENAEGGVVRLDDPASNGVLLRKDDRGKEERGSGGEDGEVEVPAVEPKARGLYVNPKQRVRVLSVRLSGVGALCVHQKVMRL
jgi:hypothetical protein